MKSYASISTGAAAATAPQPRCNRAAHAPHQAFRPELPSAYFSSRHAPARTRFATFRNSEVSLLNFLWLIKICLICSYAKTREHIKYILCGLFLEWNDVIKSESTAFGGGKKFLTAWRWRQLLHPSHGGACGCDLNGKAPKTMLFPFAKRSFDAFLGTYPLFTHSRVDLLFERSFGHGIINTESFQHVLSETPFNVWTQDRVLNFHSRHLWDSLLFALTASYLRERPCGHPKQPKQHWALRKVAEITSTNPGSGRWSLKPKLSSSFGIVFPQNGMLALKKRRYASTGISKQGVYNQPHPQPLSSQTPC